MSGNDLTSSRKEDHIRICLDDRVEGEAPTGLDDFKLEYDALPELDLEEVALGCEMLGKPLKAPLLIGAITGGTERAETINRNLARAAGELGVGLCLGSQRAMIESPELACSFEVRTGGGGGREPPLVLGNIGAVQLNRGVTSEQIAKGLSRVGVDGVMFHINPLQEAIQPEGDTCFGGLTEKLAESVAELPFPCLVKEVGAGISAKTARKLAELPIDGVEAAGVGGTSWAMVESLRAGKSPRSEAGRQLASFGVPTARAVLECRKAMGKKLVVGSGGIRTGYQAAVALALGADAVALAKPLLEPALESAQAVVEALRVVIEGLRVVMFCCGCRTPRDLRDVGFLDGGPEWAHDLLRFRAMEE
jgi:isopentenyl-diphosphate delta-isomerase